MHTLPSTVLFGCALVALAACESKGPATGSPAVVPSSRASAAPVVPTLAPRSAAPSPRDFEGEILAVIHRGKDKAEGEHLNVRFRSPRVRITLPGEVAPFPRVGATTARLLLDAAMKKTVLVAESEQAYVVFPTDELTEQIGSFAPAHVEQKPSETEPAKASKLDKGDTISGIACDNYSVQFPGGGHATFCAANRDVAGLSIPAAGLPPEYAWAADFLDGHHLPLRFVHFDARGAEDARVEVEKLQQRAVDVGELQVPSEYRRIDLQSTPGLLAARAIADKNRGAPVERASLKR